jgi:hypothetical protein
MQPATVRNYSDLIRLLCARRDELNLCHETLDALAGLQNGYASKILTPHHLRKLGPVSWSLVEALGLAVTIAKRRKRWRGCGGIMPGASGAAGEDRAPGGRRPWRHVIFQSGSHP